METEEKVKLDKPEVGMKLWAREDDLEFIPKKFLGKDGEIVSISKDGLFVEIKFDIDDEDKMNRGMFSFLNKDTTIEDFWEVFYLKKEQKPCYDPEYIYIAGDGDGGYYSFDSEEMAEDYCYKHNEEYHKAFRSYIESRAAEMFVLLKYIAMGESSPTIQKNIKKIVREINKKQPHLDDYLAHAYLRPGRIAIP